MWYGETPRRCVAALAFAPGGGVLYAVGAGHCLAWDLAAQAGRRLFPVRGAPATFRALVTPDGADLLVHALDAGQDHFWSWDVAAGRLVYPNARDLPCAGSYAFTHGVTLSPAGGVAFAAGGAQLLATYPATGRLYRHAYRGPRASDARPVPQAQGVAADPAAASAAVSTESGTVHVFDTEADRLVSKVKLAAGVVPTAMALAARGVLALALPEELRLYDAATGTMLASRLTPRPVTHMALAEGTPILATADGSAHVNLWGADALDPRGRYDWKVGRVRALALAPDGLTGAAGGSTRRFAVFDIG